MKYCLSCNTELVDQTKYCHMCGALIKETLDYKDMDFESGILSKNWFRKPFNRMFMSSPEILIGGLITEKYDVTIQQDEKSEIEACIIKIKIYPEFYLNQIEPALMRKNRWTKEHLIEKGRLPSTDIKSINTKWQEEKKALIGEKIRKLGIKTNVVQEESEQDTPKHEMSVNWSGEQREYEDLSIWDDEEESERLARYEFGEDEVEEYYRLREEERDY